MLNGGPYQELRTVLQKHSFTNQTAWGRVHIEKVQKNMAAVNISDPKYIATPSHVSITLTLSRWAIIYQLNSPFNKFAFIQTYLVVVRSRITFDPVL